MSKCISRHGEYSEHELEGDYCKLCGVFDEDAVLAQRDALAAVIDRVRSMLGELDLDSSKVTAPGTAWGSILRESIETLEGAPISLAELAKVRAEAWQEGAEHVYREGGKCSFARDGDPCPYNPYRTTEGTER